MAASATESSQLNSHIMVKQLSWTFNDATAMYIFILWCQLH